MLIDMELHNQIIVIIHTLTKHSGAEFFFLDFHNHIWLHAHVGLIGLDMKMIQLWKWEYLTMGNHMIDPLDRVLENTW